MRNTNIELLRIVSMFLIALHHFSWHGPWPKTGVLSADIAIDFLAFGGKLGCNLFVLITGYYMIRSRFKIRSIIRLVAQTAFYSWLILFAAFVYGEGISIWDLESAIIPVSTGEYWFVTTFVVLCFLTPLLNKAFLALSHSQRGMLLSLGFVLFVIVPTICLSNSYTSNLIWFCYVYYIGGFIRLSKDNANSLDASNLYLKDGRSPHWTTALFNPAQLALSKPRSLALVSTAITFLSVVIINYAQRKIGFNLVDPTYLMGQNMITTALSSFGCLVVFLELKIPCSKIINTFGGAALGVYLIHDNPFVRRELWDLFQPVYNEGFFAIIMTGVIVSVLVFIVCSSFDIFRKYTLEKPFMSFLNSKLSHKLDRVDGLLNFN